MRTERDATSTSTAALTFLGAVDTVTGSRFLLEAGGVRVLVDAGLRGFARTITEAAAEFTGSPAPPAAIVLTHGHFDHIGSLDALLEQWGSVPVFAHRLERLGGDREDRRAVVREPRGARVPVSSPRCTFRSTSPPIWMRLPTRT